MIWAIRRVFSFIGLGIGTILAVGATLSLLLLGLGFCVESVAYLSHATPAVTFVPTGTEESCSDSGCGALTDGYLLPDHEAAHTQTAFRIGEPVTVRAPILGKVDPNLITTEGGAAGMLIAGIVFLLMDIVVGLVGYASAIDKWGDMHGWYDR